MHGDVIDPASFGAAFVAFMETVAREAGPPTSPLLERIRHHLGGDVTSLPVMSESFDPFEHPNVQVALDDYFAQPDRTAVLAGIALEHKRFMELHLSDLVAGSLPVGRSGVAEGPVDYVDFHLDGDRVLPCVQFGLYFATVGRQPLLVLVAGPNERGGPRPQVWVEAMATVPDVARAFLTELRERMDRNNVYRGKVISLAPGQLGMGAQTLVAFHRLPRVDRADVILPEGLLGRIERQTVAFSAHAETLLASGRSLKRGILLYGVPGTGKTLTLMYLIGQMPGRTVLLTTGLGVGLLQPVMQLARTLTPSMVVLEDVDLIAEERGRPFGHSGPLLFELLNELDGLRDDCDVIFALTTNRPDVLEPALAARPGRIDLVVELPLPDAGGRLRLLDRYARGVVLTDVDVAGLVAQTDGATPAYIKELLRKTALLAAIAGRGNEVTRADFDTALAELDEGGALARRLAGFRAPGDEPGPGGPPGMPPRPPAGMPGAWHGFSPRS